MRVCEGLRRGAYVLSDTADREPQLILIASGSEVGLILAAAERLQNDGIGVRCVSMPSWDLFEAQPKAYRDEVLPHGPSNDPANQLQHGQKILAEREAVPTNPKVKAAPDGLIFVDLARFMDEGGKWTKLFRDTFTVR